MKKINILAFSISIAVTFLALLSLNYLNKNNADTSVSNINIMNTNYKASRDYILDDYYIFDYSQKEQKLKEIFKTDFVSSRLKYRASLISHLGEEEIVINGIDIENDNKVFGILNKEVLKDFNTDNSIIISKSISSVLDVGINDKIILKLITKTGHYNAEEYNIIEVSDKLNYNYALIDINNLNKFAGLENAATEIYIKKNIKDEKLINYDNYIKQIFSHDFAAYSKKDILGDNYNINKGYDNYKIYIVLMYFFLLFSIFIFLNSYTINTYREDTKSKLLYTVLGFAAAFIIYMSVLIYKAEFVFDYLYLFMFIMSALSSVLSDIKFSILEKMFIKDEEYKKNKNALMMFGMIFTYTIVFLLLYLSFFAFVDKDKNEESAESIVRIVKNNTTGNTFLFNGSISVTNLLFGEINSYDKYADIETVLTFPVGVVIRTGSISSRVYTYDKNILESGASVSNIIIEGEMFENDKREIIIGKDLASYLNLKIGDALSLIAKASRGWLETGYFYVSGIYDLKDRNYDIIGGSSSMTSFIYLKEGDKSPYNESVIVFSDNDDIYSLLNGNQFIIDNDLKAVSADKRYYGENNYSIKNITVSFIIILAFVLSLLSSSMLYILQRRSEKINNDAAFKKLYIISLLVSMIVSMIIIFVFMPFSFRLLLFTMSIILLSFILSFIISNNSI